MTALEIGETSKVPEVSKTPSGVGFVTGYATSNDVCTHPVPEADVVVPVGGTSPTGGVLRASVGDESVCGQDEDLEGERLLKTSRLDGDVLTAEVSPQTHAEEREAPFRSAADGERAVVVEISVPEPNVAREADVDVPVVDTSPTGEPLRTSVGDARVIGQDDDVEGGKPDGLMRSGLGATSPSRNKWYRRFSQERFRKQYF